MCRRRASSRRWATTRPRQTRATCWWMNRSKPISRISGIAFASRRWPVAWRLLIDHRALWPFQNRVGTTRGRVHRCLHQCGRQSVCRNVQPTERLFRHRPRQLRSEPSPAVSAQHQLRGLVFPVHDPAWRKDERFLGTECLAVVETDNDTPYFLNLHVGDVAHTLILGMTGSGKSYLCNFILQNAQKYKPLTFIFDIGGSFQSLTTIFEGSYLERGPGRRRTSPSIPSPCLRPKRICSFSSASSAYSLRATSSVTGSISRRSAELWDAIERIYVLEPNQRTISNFSNIIGELKEHLRRWTRRRTIRLPL